MAKFRKKRSSKKFNKGQKISFTICNIFFIAIGFLDILILDLFHIPIWLYEMIFVVDFIIYLVWLVLCILDYKLKYLFLGNEYKKQIALLTHLKKYNNYYCNYMSLKTLKHNYRIYGDILRPFRSIDSITPMDLLINDCYGTTDNDEEKWKNTLLVQLYLSISEGQGLCGYFEQLSACYFVPYEDLRKTIKSIDVLPPKLKSLLTGTRAKKVFEYTAEYTCLTDEDVKVLEKYEKNYSHLGDEYENELLEIVGKIAVKKYKKVYRLYTTLPNVVKIFINKENDLRYIIWFDKKTKTYRMQGEILSQLFYYNVPALYNIYSWQAKESFGLFADVNLAKNELENKLVDFEEIDMS